jgi:protein MpaA
MKQFTEIIGHTFNGRPIEAIRFAKEKPTLMLSAGLHGDEVEGVITCTQILGQLLATKPEILNKLVIVPILNPDGFAQHSRCNANNVDLNRNFPSSDWSPEATSPRYPPGAHAGSEPETAAILKYILKNQIKIVVDLHSYKEAVLLPLYKRNDNALDTHVRTLSQDTGLPIVYEQTDLGYAIGGGLHNWCFEHDIHNLTIELPRGAGQTELATRFVAPIVKCLALFR